GFAQALREKPDHVEAAEELHRLLLEGFDPEYYRRTYPDVAESGMDPLAHYLEYGRAEGRSYAQNTFPEGFDPEYYRRTYPDVAESGMEPLTHYLEYGRAEGRSCAQSVNP
ncbi:hypothetical protein KUA02_16795, partial [Komagataeibacter pomaceti]|nr:hypothetical protein [Novacetimonas pomaceti]